MTSTVDVEELVSRYGSPLYVYELDRVRSAAADLVAALPTPARVCYSMKANPHPAIAGCLAGLGFGAEVSSGGELLAALDAGVPADRIVYTGPGKTVEEMDLALDRRVGRYSAESFVDLARIGDLAAAWGTDVDVLIRVNGPASGDGAPARFGFDHADLVRDWDAARVSARVSIVGLRFCPLTNVRDEELLIGELIANLRTAATVRDELGLPVRVLDLGGGFSAPIAQRGERPRYRRIADRLADVLDEAFPGWRAGAVEVMFESGRYLAADCGTLLTSVLDVKSSRGKEFVVLDAGLNAPGGGPVRPVGREAPGHHPADLVDPLCTPADSLGRGGAVPGLVVGELVRIPNVGAYGLTAGLLGFGSRTPPTEVVVDDGRVVSATATEIRYSPVQAG